MSSQDAAKPSVSAIKRTAKVLANRRLESRILLSRRSVTGRATEQPHVLGA